MDSFQPKVITRSNPARIEIEWTDGHRTSYATADLRRLCPCARCVDETTGIRVHNPATVAADLVHNDVRMVGNYAIAISFGDGHDTGIFPFRYLRENDPGAP
jgi:DUF971 family protein